MLRIVISFAALLISTMAVSAPTPSQLDRALHDVVAEEVVFDAAWKDRTVPVMYVRIFDNGTRRDGYAGYICMVISESGINGGRVSLIDVVGSEEKELGSARCK